MDELDSELGINNVSVPQSALLESVLFDDSVIPSAPVATLCEDWDCIDSIEYQATTNDKENSIHRLFRRVMPSRAVQIDNVVNQARNAHLYLQKNPKMLFFTGAVVGAALVSSTQTLLTGSLVYICLPKVTIINNHHKV